MSKQSIIWIIVAIIIIGLIIIFSPGKTKNPAEGETIKIGYIGPLTGGGSVLGVDVANAIKMAVDNVNNNGGGINGQQVELFIEDDQYDAAKTVSAYQKLVEINDVDNLLVSTYGGLFAIADLAKKDDVLVIDVLDCDKDIADLPDNIFCVAKESEDYGNVLAKFALEQKYKEIGALVNSDDKFMPSIVEIMQNKIGKEGNIQVEKYIGGNTSDFKTMLLKFKDKNAIVFLGYDEIGTAIKQARSLGMNQAFLSLSIVSTPATKESSGGAVEGIYFPDYLAQKDNEKLTDFRKEFKLKNDRDPFIFFTVDQAYDAISILVNEVLPKSSNIQEKIKAMHAIKNWNGVSGILSIKEDGRSDGVKMDLFQLRNLMPTHIGI